MSAEQPVLAISGVSKSYGKVQALSGLDMGLAPGTFNVLLGPNGAGKSTLFQLLSGLFIADAGSITVDGFDLKSSPVPVLARLGIVFQQATLDLDLSAVGNLRFHARLHGMTGTTERIAEEIERVGLTEDAGKPCRELSGGNRRKVELARAVLHRPKLLLMDEPTVGLDPVSRRDLLAFVHTLCKEQGLTVLWATHLVDEAVGCDRMLVLREGVIVADGTPAALQAEHGADDISNLFFALTGKSA